MKNEAKASQNCAEDRVCPVMSRRAYNEEVKCTKDCAWYMTLNNGDSDREAGICAIAFGMLCQQGVAGSSLRFLV